MRLIALPAVLVAFLPMVADGQVSDVFRVADRISPWAILRITVSKYHAMDRLVMVCPDGKISLPLLTDVQAAGLTTGELRGVLTERFKHFIPSPEVSVELTQVEKGSKIVVFQPEGKTMRRIPFNYNKLAPEEQWNDSCSRQGGVFIVR